MVSDDAIIAELQKVQSKSTHPATRSSLRALMRITGVSLERALLDVDKTMAAIRIAYPKTGSSHAKVKAAVVALRTCGAIRGRVRALERWRALQTDLDQTRREQENDNKATAEDLRRMVPIEHVARAAEAIPHATLRQSQHKVLLTIGAYVWPKRADWSVRIVGPRESIERHENALRLSKTRAVLHLAAFKTAGHYGTYEEVLPDHVAAVIRESIARFPRRFLFVQERTGKPWTKQNLSEYMPKIYCEYVGRAVGVNVLRHMWISQRIDYNRMTIAETNELARKMMHSPSEQRRYFRVGAQFLETKT